MICLCVSRWIMNPFWTVGSHCFKLSVSFYFLLDGLVSYTCLQFWHRFFTFLNQESKSCLFATYMQRYKEFGWKYFHSLVRVHIYIHTQRDTKMSKSGWWHKGTLRVVVYRYTLTQSAFQRGVMGTGDVLGGTAHTGSAVVFVCMLPDCRS